MKRIYIYTRFIAIAMYSGQLKAHCPIFPTIKEKDSVYGGEVYGLLYAL